MASNRKNWGEVASAGASSSTASVSTSVLDPSLFSTNWRAKVTNSNGDVVTAEHGIMHPSGEKAFFHVMLDASSSTKLNVTTGRDRKPVYEYLIDNFEQLVTGADTPMLPGDVIYVWTFNMKTTLLCRVEKTSFHARLPSIRAAYKTELYSGKNTRGTHLYDAVETVMKQVFSDYQAHKRSDIFLALFTDGQDIGSQTSLDDMIENVQFMEGRLHTFFITANMGHNSALYKRLHTGQQISEMNLIECETMEPPEISRAFRTLRSLIKSYLLVQHPKDGKLHNTKITAYGANENAVANQLLNNLYSNMDCSLIGSLYQMRIQGRDRAQEVPSYSGRDRIEEVDWS